MDRSHEEMKFMGLVGIMSESFKTILTWKKIFTHITLTLILPLVIIFIAHMEISKRLFHKIEPDPYELFSGAQDVYRSYYTAEATPTLWLYYLLFKTISIIILIIFSLLSTAAVVYTIASIYTGRDASFRKAMKVVPKVWKRLIVTFLSMFLTFFAYNLIAAVVFFLWRVILMTSVVWFFALLAIFIPYILGFVYLSIIWQVASVVSVLENCYGLKALMKAMDLMKGKRMVGFAISILSYTLLVGEVVMYMALILYDGAGLGLLWKLMIGILCWVLLLITFLLLMVTQTMLYLVCKSHHRETIDKLSLSTYLGAYLGESHPAFKMGEDIQLGSGRSQPQPQPESASQV